MESERINVQKTLQSVNTECMLNNNDSPDHVDTMDSWSTKMYEIGVIGLIESDEGVGNSNSPTVSRSQSHTSLPSTPVSERCETPDRVFFQDSKRFKSCETKPSVNDQVKENLFNVLSDEIIISIFSLVPKHVLATVSLVCKRFRRLCLDNSLWPRYDLSFKTLPPRTLGYVLSRGVRALRLNSSSVMYPVFDPLQNWKPGFMFKVEYLDLSSVHISVKDLEMLLSRCCSLRKLSVEACELSDNICEYIAQNLKLDTLDMAMCTGLSDRGLRSIVTSCQRLENVNVSWCNLSTEAVSCFCRNVTPALVSVNLSGALRSLSNQDVESLVDRCLDLTELDISDCLKVTGLVTDSLVAGADNLQKLSISRCYKIGANNVLQLKGKPSLCMLNMFGNSHGEMFPSDVMKYLKSSLPGVAINSEVMSPIARPTVGIRRTSIWEIRCRE